MRKSPRAPTKVPILCAQNESVFQGRALNIGLGGILWEGVHSLTCQEDLFLMFPLVEYPFFERLGFEGLKRVEFESLSRTILRVRTRVLRSKRRKESSHFKIACQFLSFKERERELMKKYLCVYLENLTFFLNLFERGSNCSQSLFMITKMAQLWGQDSMETRHAWRLRALHDYPSLLY